MSLLYVITLVIFIMLLLVLLFIRAHAILLCTLGIWDALLLAGCNRI